MPVISSCDALCGVGSLSLIGSETGFDGPETVPEGAEMVSKGSEIFFGGSET